MPELERKVEECLRVFEEFKTRNDKEIGDIKKGKYVPADIKEVTEKHNQAIDDLQKKAEQLEAALNRETAAGQEDPKAREAEMKSIANSWFRGKSLNTDEYKKLGDELGSKHALPQELKTLNAGTDTEGGFFVRPFFASEIQKRVYETSPVRQFASVVQISTSSYEELADWDEPAASWVGELGTRSQTDENDISKLVIPVHEMYAMPYASQSLLDDAALDVESWHAQKVAEAFARTEATAFCTGNGVNQPRGIASYTSGTGFQQIQQVGSGSAGAFTANGLIDCQNALFEAFQGNARWMMARASAGAIRKLVDGVGQYLWSVDRGLSGGMQNFLLAKPVHFASDVAAIASGSLSAYYGDFKEGYLIVDRVGMRVLRDPYSSKPSVIFYTTKRVGGGVKQSQALKLQVLT